MLENRHSLSRAVCAAVSPLSEKWGYALGSVYIRKVAFTDRSMVENITEKVVKRLVQVTSAMKQDGDNRVGLIQSETAKKVTQNLAESGAGIEVLPKSAQVLIQLGDGGTGMTVTAPRRA